MKPGDLQEANLTKRALERMTPKKIAVAFLILAAVIAGAFWNPARAANPTPTNFIYDGNQLIEIDFSDGSSLIFNYDANGNLISKTPRDLISVSVIGYGTVSPTSSMVNYGGSQTFTITPPQGVIWNVQVDGQSLGEITSYTFNDVTVDHTLSVDFDAIQNSSSGAAYQSLQTAYEAAQSGNTIMVQSGVMTESFKADQGISVTISGGYSVNYSSNSGMTTIEGVQTISNGLVTWGNFVISN